MEENVALDSKKQRKFVKSIRGIKKLIKKNEGKAEPQKKDEKVEPKKPFSMKLKGGKVSKKRKRKEKGLVYLSHIPHGFYEHQMTQYFKQFGVVTNARVIRSKRTGNSKGFAFVEFKEPAVGQIVAETMNNYLMGKRLIKAAYIPPEKQKLRAFRKNWNSLHNPASNRRLKTKKEFNADKDDIAELKRARKLLSNLNKNKKKLSEIGVNYDFFTPVDVPEALLNDIVKQEKEDNKGVKEESKPKKAEKGKKEQKENKNANKNVVAQNGKQTNEAKGKKNNKNQKDNKPAEVPPKKVKAAEAKKAPDTKTAVEAKKSAEPKKETAPKADKKEKEPVKINKKQQKEKEQKLKAAGVRPAEFIKVGEQDSEVSDDDSDSAYEFDSDAYDKMLEKMSENSELSFLSDEDDESGGEDEGEVSEDDDGSDEEEAPPKKGKGKPAPKVVQPAQTRKQVLKQIGRAHV